MVRIIAGGYIDYLAYQLVTGILKGEIENPVMFGIFAAVFAVAGTYFLVSSILYLIKHKDDQTDGEVVEPSADDDMADLEEAEQKLEELPEEPEEPEHSETIEEKMERLKEKDLEEIVEETYTGEDAKEE